MKQELICYVKGKEEVHHLSIDGSLEVHDILAELILKISDITHTHSRDILHDVSGKIQIIINQ